MKTIDDLENAIRSYMDFDVEGSDFEDEQDFEDAVKEMLIDEGFKVLPKKNVENTNKLIEGTFSKNVDRQIPDISVDCEDGTVMLELKFCREPSVYEDDEDKVEGYLRAGVCDVSGVLFLDDVMRKGWKTCGMNDDFTQQVVRLTAFKVLQQSHVRE